jgi:NAD-dependent dihydropyrimidine dehydrogenase PreA subunit
MARRQIIHIDEELCTGCGECIPSCAEGALVIVDGKARVVADRLCDGLGACLGQCPEDALTIEERDAPEFDEVAVEQRLQELGVSAQPHAHADTVHPSAGSFAEASPTGGCPGSLARELRPTAVAAGGGCPGSAARVLQASGSTPIAAAPAAGSGRDDGSLLQHWPVQLGLVSPMAPFLRGADLLIAADCAPVAYRRFHEDFLAGRSVVIACPKLDDARAHMEKLAELFQASRPRTVTVVHMEVPCCFGLASIVEQAASLAGLEAPVNDVTITLDGSKSERLLRPAAGVR